MSIRASIRFVAALVPFLAAAACNSSPTTPTTTTSTPIYVAEQFAGNLAPGGSSFHSFLVGQGGTVSIMLATTTTDQGTPISQPIQLSVGTPDGTAACTITRSLTATASLTSQISSFMASGVYCVDVTDTGTVTDAFNYNIRVVHP